MFISGLEISPLTFFLFYHLLFNLILRFIEILPAKLKAFFQTFHFHQPNMFGDLISFSKSTIALGDLQKYNRPDSQ